MSIKYNKRGEVVSVNGLTTGHHIGTPMQDAIAERPEHNQAYWEELSTVTRTENMVEDAQPKPVSAEETKPIPIELADFQYFTWDNLSGDTLDEKARQLARYGVIIYQGELSSNRSMSGDGYKYHVELYTKALEYNPDLKVFGYLTARGFANSLSGGHVGMTKYRTSPKNVDHPIWTKEELAAYIDLMAHCGGVKDSTTNEFGNPVLVGGIPLYGVFFDDYDYNFEDDNTHLMNQGDWATIREKHNFLIDYVHSRGMKAMPNSNPNLIFDNTPTPNSVRNPNGVASHMNENDWFSTESYFLRFDNTFSLNDEYVTDYNEKYRETYKSKCLVLTYVGSVADDAEDNEQIASTFAVYQALCQGADAIALHDTELFTKIPDDFAKYYDKDGTAIRRSGNGFYSLTVNGHTITASRSTKDTIYGKTPDSKALSTCKITIDGQHTFNNMYVTNEELVYRFSDLKNTVANNSNLYQRAFIDDWENDSPFRTWFTNYAPPMSDWGIMGHWSTYTLERNGETVITNYTSKSGCYESGVQLPADNTIFKPGETWEIGFKDIKMTYADGSGDVSDKIVIALNLGTDICPDIYMTNRTYDDFCNMKSATGDDSLIAITRFTIPENYSGGMSATPLYVWPANFIGGDANGLYKLIVKGLYMYKIDERDELAVRGQDPSETYIGINRVRTDTMDEDLKPDSVYLVDDGSMFTTDYQGNRVPYLPVLTSPGGKRFKLTVDDSGKITATEV